MNRQRNIQNISLAISLGLGCALIVTLLSAGAQAAEGAAREVRVGPVWSHSLSSISSHPNVSFLSDLSRIQTSEEAKILSHAFGESSDLRFRYERMMESYETHQMQGMTDLELDRSHLDNMAALTHDAESQVRQHQLDSQKEKLENIAKSGSFDSVRKPVEIAVAIAAVYSGHPVAMNVSDKTRVVARTDVRSQQGQLQVQSPLIDSSLDFTGTNPAVLDPTQAFTLDPTEQAERYKLSFSRALGVWDLHSGLTYGGTSNLVTASVSKQLMPGLRCVLDSSRSVSDVAQVAQQDSLKLFYDIHF